MSKKRDLPPYPAKAIPVASVTQMEKQLERMLKPSTHCKECGDRLTDDDIIYALETGKGCCYACSDEYCPGIDDEDE